MWSCEAVFMNVRRLFAWLILKSFSSVAVSKQFGSPSRLSQVAVGNSHICSLCLNWSSTVSGSLGVFWLRSIWEHKSNHVKNKAYRIYGIRLGLRLPPWPGPNYALRVDDNPGMISWRHETHMSPFICRTGVSFDSSSDLSRDLKCHLVIVIIFGVSIFPFISHLRRLSRHEYHGSQRKGSKSVCCQNVVQWLICPASLSACCLSGIGTPRGRKWTDKHAQYSKWPEVVVKTMFHSLPVLMHKDSRDCSDQA